MNEADTCRKYVVPKLQAAGWENAPCSIAEQRTFTNPKGRIRIIGSRIVRRKPKRADYLLRYRREYPVAVVEAKADYQTPGAGLSQAKEYAEILDLKFAEIQKEFKSLLDLRNKVQHEAQRNREHQGALLPSLLDRIFKGEI